MINFLLEMLSTGHMRWWNALVAIDANNTLCISNK